jgi:hypothetical protein
MSDGRKVEKARWVVSIFVAVYIFSTAYGVKPTANISCPTAARSASPAASLLTRIRIRNGTHRPQKVRPLPHVEGLPCLSAAQRVRSPAVVAQQGGEGLPTASLGRSQPHAGGVSVIRQLSRHVRRRGLTQDTSNSNRMCVAASREGKICGCRCYPVCLGWCF